MQSKMVLQVLLRIFGGTQYETAVAALKAFLPLSMKHFEKAVMSSALARALDVWHTLAHAADLENRPQNFEEILDGARNVLTSKALQCYHRPIARLSSTTLFKRFLQESHQLVVAEKLNKHAAEKALQVGAAMNKVTLHLSAMTTGPEDDMSSFDFSKVIVALEVGLASS